MPSCQPPGGGHGGHKHTDSMHHGLKRVGAKLQRRCAALRCAALRCAALRAHAKEAAARERRSPGLCALLAPSPRQSWPYALRLLSGPAKIQTDKREDAFAEERPRDAECFGVIVRRAWLRFGLRASLQIAGPPPCLGAIQSKALWFTCGLLFDAIHKCGTRGAAPERARVLRLKEGRRHRQGPSRPCNALDDRRGARCPRGERELGERTVAGSVARRAAGVAQRRRVLRGLPAPV